MDASRHRDTQKTHVELAALHHAFALPGWTESIYKHTTVPDKIYLQ